MERSNNINKYLINKFYYKNLLDLYKGIYSICYLNYSYDLDRKQIIFYQVYMYFILTLYFGQPLSVIHLSTDSKRLSFKKKYPLGLKINFNKSFKIYYFLECFNKWYYYNSFSEVKRFFFDKKNYRFFGLSIPFLNLFFCLDYNILTFLIYNLNIPSFKILVNIKNGSKFENMSLRSYYGLY